MGDITVEQLERYEQFVSDLEYLCNRHKVRLTADREENVMLEDLGDDGVVGLSQLIYRDTFVPTHIYYELQTKVF